MTLIRDIFSKLTIHYCYSVAALCPSHAGLTENELQRCPKGHSFPDGRTVAMLPSCSSNTNWKCLGELNS